MMLRLCFGGWGEFENLIENEKSIGEAFYVEMDSQTLFDPKMEGGSKMFAAVSATYNNLTATERSLKHPLNHCDVSVLNKFPYQDCNAE